MNYDSSAIIMKPERVAAFNRRKKILQLACGIKHYILLTAGMYGPHCYVLSGIYKEKGNGKQIDDRKDGKDRKDRKEVEEDKEKEIYKDDNDYEILAGQRIKFIIQGKDYHNDICDTGGAVLLSNIDHDSIDYDIRYRRQLNEIKLINNSFVSSNTGINDTKGDKGDSGVTIPKIDIDDNMDGTYGCTYTLHLTGSYRIFISLYGQNISSSPFHTTVLPDKLSPRHCRIWWGKFKRPAGAQLKNEGTGTNYGIDSGIDSEILDSTNQKYLECLFGESIIFTVSCYDKYGNKCVDTEDYSVSARFSQDQSTGKADLKEGYDIKKVKYYLKTVNQAYLHVLLTRHLD